MRGAGFLKGGLHRGGDAALHAQEDARQQGGFRVGPQAVDGFQGARLEAQEKAQEGIAPFARQTMGFLGLQNGVDALAGEVGAVREGFALRRRFGTPFQADSVPVAPRLPRRETRQEQALHRPESQGLGGAELCDAHPQADAAIAHIGRGGDPAADDVFLAGIVVPGDESGCDFGLNESVTHSPQGEKDEQSRGAGAAGQEQEKGQGGGGQQAPSRGGEGRSRGQEHSADEGEGGKEEGGFGSLQVGKWESEQV